VVRSFPGPPLRTSLPTPILEGLGEGGVREGAGVCDPWPLPHRLFGTKPQPMAAKPTGTAYPTSRKASRIIWLV